VIVILHAASDLLLGKSFPVSVGQEDSWTPGSVWIG